MINKIENMRGFPNGINSKIEREKDSDLDILVVLNNVKIPENYDEKILLKAKVRKAIREINQQIPIDLVVYTKPEYEEFLKLEGSFFNTVKETGKVIYESAN